MNAQEWEFKLENMSPFATREQLQELLDQAPLGAPSRGWLKRHIAKRDHAVALTVPKPQRFALLKKVFARWSRDHA